MATACVDFFTTTTEPEFAEAVDEAELDRTNDVLGYGRILKKRYDAEKSFKSQFTPYMAAEIERFRDDHWTPKSHAKATITWTEDGQTKTGDFTWDEFVEDMFGVSRSWLNKILKSYHPKPVLSDDDETDEVEDDSSDDSNPLADRLEELEAEAIKLAEENKNLKAQFDPEDDELDKVARIIKRHAVGSVEVYARILQQIVEKAGYDNRIRVLVN